MDVRATKVLGDLFHEVVGLRNLSLDKRKERIVVVARDVDYTADDLYNALLTSVLYLCKQAILAIPEKPDAYREFLVQKDDLLAMIPDKSIPEPIRAGVYERLGELILVEETQELQLLVGFSTFFVTAKNL